ncbi:RNA polymerase II transcription factor B subunit 1 [Cryptotrichosporon argae]
MSTSQPRQFEAEFKKTPGILTLTETHVAWVPSQAGTMDRQSQAMSRVTTMMASKAGSARVSLKLLFKDDVPAGGLLFTFTNASTREADRQTMQDILIPFVTANRTGPDAGSTPAAASPIVSGPSTPAGASPGTPSAVARGKRKADEMSAESRRSLNQLRLRVLRKNPTLKVLYQELVMNKQITEDEFWDGRQALLQTEELAQAQKPGRPSRLLDDRFDLSGTKRDASKIQGGTGVGLKKVDTGPIVLNITKELTREIFEEFPVVQDAYAKHVPGISETEFWKRYFTSALWEQHRASVRKSATDDGARKKDDIFEAYLEDPDWNVQPRKALPDDVERFLDLAATEEDHGETATVRDVTMQAGRERGALPLIRRFNEHSQKLVQAGRAGTGTTRSTLPFSTASNDIGLYAEIEYEDLRGPAQAPVIPLDVADSAIQDDDQDDSTRGVMPRKSDEELAPIVAEEASRIAGWSLDFSAVCLPNPINPHNEHPPPPALAGADTSAFTYQRDAQAMARNVVRDLHVAANAEEAVYAPLPEVILEQMRSCHNAATEFLRQYYTAILPTAAGALGAGTPSTAPAAKAARAEKMARYLEGTEGKVNAIVAAAEIGRSDPDRVRAAMAPTLGAVAVALRREKQRVAAAAR